MTAFFGQVLINAGNNFLTVDSTDTALRSARWFTWHGESTDRLVDHLAGVITEAAASAVVTASVDADGFLTLTGTAAFEVTNFTGYEIFGFDSDSLTGESEYTAPNRLFASWIPGRPESVSLAPVSTHGQPRSLVAQQQAADKTLCTTEIGEHIFQTFTFEYVTKAKTWDEDGTRNGFVEWFETIQDGRRFLFVPEWIGSSGTYTVWWQYVWNLKDQPEPQIRRQPRTQTTDLYWSIVVPMRGVDPEIAYGSVEADEMSSSPRVIYNTPAIVDVELPLAALGNDVLYTLQNGIAYPFSGGEQLDLSTSGVGGRDTGAEVQGWWHVYLVVDSGVLKPMASQSWRSTTTQVSTSGSFSRWRMIGVIS
jgi:hypothetical protein